jgi:hypothetical protein
VFTNSYHSNIKPALFLFITFGGNKLERLSLTSLNDHYNGFSKALSIPEAFIEIQESIS